MSTQSLTASWNSKATLAAYTAVVIDTDGKLIQASAGGPCDGIINEGVTSGDDTGVVLLGQSRAIAGGALLNSSRALMVGAAGKLVAYVAAAANVHVANLLRSEKKLSAADTDEINVVLVGSPLDR